MAARRHAISVYFHPRLLAILALGFSSGLPLSLSASTLAVWLTESGVSTTIIGTFAAAATPYALKFLWAPLIDGIRLPVFCKAFGQRRGWLLATQIALMAAIACFAFCDPAAAPYFAMALAFSVAFFSASQDIVIDAYRVEILKPDQYGAGAAMVIFGYRLGMIAASAGALYLATYFGWHVTYLIMAGLILVGVATVLINKEPTVSPHPVNRGHWLRDHVAAPLKDFIKREHWQLILGFVILYRLADAFLGLMENPFLINLGFSKTQIADVVKICGLIATIIGSFLGGAMVFRLGTIKVLWISGILHAATNLMFVAQAHIGADIKFLALGISLENITGGISGAAFVAFLSSLCNLRFTATQYALLSSLAAFGRTWLSTPAGWLAQSIGWSGFFSFASALALPGLAALFFLQRLNKSEKLKPP